MSHYSRLFKAHLRRSWILLISYLVSLILMVTVSTQSHFLGNHGLGFAIVLLTTVLAITIILSLNHGQYPASSETWWLTRPIGRWQMVIAHIQFILITLAGPLLVAQIATLSIMKATDSQFWVGIIFWLLLVTILILIYVPLALKRRSLEVFFSLFLICQGAIFFSFSFDNPETPKVTEALSAELSPRHESLKNEDSVSHWNGVTLTSKNTDEIFQPLKVRADSGLGEIRVLEFMVTRDRDLVEELALDLVNRNLPIGVKIAEPDSRRFPGSRSIILQNRKIVREGVVFNGGDSADLISRRHRLVILPEMEMEEGARSCAEGIALTIVQVQTVESIRVDFQISALPRASRNFFDDQIGGKIVWLLYSESTGGAFLSEVRNFTKPEDLIGLNLFGQMDIFDFQPHKGGRNHYKLRPYLIFPEELVECSLEIEAGNYWGPEPR